MINLVGYDDFGKEIRFNLSQVKVLDYRRCSMTILADEYEVIDPETVRCLDCEEIDTLREQVKVLREALEEARAAANHVHTACIDPNRPRQSIGEIAHHLVTTLDVLSQTKPKDGK